MKINIIKNYVGIAAIIVAALVAAPLSLQAQDQNSKKSEAADASSSVAKKHRPLPFHGKTAAVDKTAMTITIGHTVLHVTSDTKITNQGKPATFSDIVVGEKISGSYLKDEAGNKNASVIHIGGKAKATGKKKKAETSDKN